MKDCSCFDFSSLCGKLKCDIKETKEGIQVDLKPKDPKKIGSLKAFAKSCRDFCGCC